MRETFFYGKKSKKMKPETKHILWLITACVAIFFVHLDALPINIMEARNFITAREMLLDDNWILTTINGEARYQKPPLPTWLTAISASIFSIKSLYALRLPAVLMAIFGVCFFYRLVRLVTNKNELSFISSLVLITSFYFTFAGRNGQWDIFTYGFMIAAIYYLFQFFKTSEKLVRNALLTALFIGLSFMSKGPVSLYTLLLPFIISYGIVFGFKAYNKKWGLTALIVVIALLISGWWYAYTYIYDVANSSVILEKETTNWSNYNVKPFYYYWDFFIQTGVWILPALVSLLYPYLKDRVAHKKGYQLSLLWTLTAVVLLSIIPEKKHRYLLPVIIPFALNIGFYIEYLFRHFSEMRRIKETSPVYLQFGAISIVGLLTPFAAGYYFWDQIGNLWPWFLLLSLSVFIGGCYILYHLIYRNIKTVFYTSIFFIAAVMVFGLPLISLLNTNSAHKEMYTLASWEQENNIKVYEYSIPTPEFLWQYGDKMERINGNDTKGLLNNTNTIGILVHEKALPKFKEEFQLFELKVVDEFDLNPVSKEKRKHNFRLHRYLYLVKKK